MGSRRNFAIVASQYNAEYVNGLVESAKRELAVIAPASQVSVVEVPGAFEIPLLVQEIASLGNIDAIIALGVIIEGETAHAALIGATVTESLQRISLTHRIPVIHEVLLVKNEEQARARCLDMELNRGIEAARVAARMVQVIAALPRQH
ncbi:MAG: 6,7-dimethyl-8-ribityllumazine synthase [Verrucomicrobiota bacterium]